MWHELTKEFSLVQSWLQAENHQLFSAYTKNWLSAPQPREMLARLRDLFGQRISEVWASLPELYLLIIFTAIFEPSLALLLALMTLFAWMGLADDTRAEFLRSRNQEYVLAARSMGLSDWQIIRCHVLPNSLTPVLAFLPFCMGAAILVLTSLDFLGLGVAQQTASQGEVLAQGKANLDAWWILLSTFAVLLGLRLVMIGEGLRAALDARSK